MHTLNLIILKLTVGLVVKFGRIIFSLFCQTLKQPPSSQEVQRCLQSVAIDGRTLRNNFRSLLGVYEALLRAHSELWPWPSESLQIACWPKNGV
jgi:hypothetical protein